MNGKKEKVAKILEKLGVKLKTEDKEKEGKQLLKVNLKTLLLVQMLSKTQS